MGRKRLHPKKKPHKKWYQKEDDYSGDFVFDWSLGLKPETWRIIFAVFVFLIGIILFLGFLGKAGEVGTAFADLIRLLFGSMGAYVFDLIFIYLGVILIKPKRHYRIAEFLGLVIILFAIPTFLHLFVPEEVATEAAEFGRNGGQIGFLISTPLRTAIGLFPTFLVTIAMIAISLMMVFNFSLMSYLGMKEGDDDDDDSRVNINDGREAKVSVFESVKRRFGSMGRGRAVNNKAQVIEVAPSSNVMPTSNNTTWEYPPLDILKELDEVANPGNIYKNAELIQKCLDTFEIKVSLGTANVGPTVTQYTLKPKDGVKLNQIVARQNDLALALSARSIRIEAPIPGKDLVGIEIPNKVAAKVTLKEILISPQFKAVKSKLALALGRDVAGEAMAIDLEKMPHMLIAGSTGSGKSVCINSLIVTLLYNNSPADLRLILVDPKRVELTCYNDIPHLLTPVVTEVDKTVSALKWAVCEMERRYKLFADEGKRNIIAYNSAPGAEGKLPYIVIIIDELADLMATSAKEVEGSIVRLAQMARATGMHLVIATQRPSVDVLTGLIKANIASRIAFATASQVDSRTILDLSGSEKLLGFGDMLFISPGIKPKRVQGCFVSDPEIEKVADYLKKQGEPQYNEAILTFGASRSGGISGGGSSIEDALYNEALDTVMAAGKASASLLQRRLKVGYARAARLLDILEENGVIGPPDGAKPRDVLISNADMASYGNDSSNYVSAYDNTKDYDAGEPEKDERYH